MDASRDFDAMDLTVLAGHAARTTLGAGRQRHFAGQVELDADAKESCEARYRVVQNQTSAMHSVRRSKQRRERYTAHRLYWLHNYIDIDNFSAQNYI